MGEGGWKAVRLDAATESSYADLTEASFSSATSCDLCFEDHTYGNTLAVKEVGGEECFDGMADSVTKVDQVAEVSFLWIVRDDGGLCVNGRDDEGEERVGSKIGKGLCVYVAERIKESFRGRLKKGKGVFIPDCRSLWDDKRWRRLTGQDEP